MDSFKRDESKNAVKQFICIIIFIAALFADIAAFSEAIETKSIAIFTVTAVFGVGLPYMIIHDILGSCVNTTGLLGRTKNERLAKNALYMGGNLPFRRSAVCDIYFDDDFLTISSGSRTFTIPYDSITKMGMEVDVVMKEPTISTPRFILGGIIGGWVGGAILGYRGRRKEANAYFEILHRVDGSIKREVFKPDTVECGSKLKMRSADVAVH